MYPIYVKHLCILLLFKRYILNFGFLLIFFTTKFISQYYIKPTHGLGLGTSNSSYLHVSEIWKVNPVMWEEHAGMIQVLA